MTDTRNPPSSRPTPPAGKPPSRSAEAWHGLISSRRHWASQAFSRSSILDALKSLLWVMPLTVLIWFYAEREQLITAPAQFPIEVKSADPAKRLVTLLPPADKGIAVELTGPLARIDEAKKAIEPAGPTPAVQIEIDASLAPGQTYDLRTIEQLERLPVFKSRGIGVRNCQPAILQIFVDKIDERDVPVQVPPGITNLESATFDPPAVRVKGPATVLDRLEKEGRLVLYAELADLPELKTPGQHEHTAVSLIRPFREPHVSVAPLAVRATLHVRQSDVEYKIPSMPVFIVSPQGLLDKYKVTYNPILTNVTVVGPPEKIELLQNENFSPKPKATLEITREDGVKVNQPQSRRVRYELPEGLKVKDEDAKREVEFKLSDRSTPE